MIEHCTGVILAGGASKRMGQDKASLIFNGQTLLARAEQHLQPLFEHVVVSVRQHRSDTHLPQILDQHESRAPILGIHAALKHVKTDWICVVAVDMPFVSPDLLCFMADNRNHHDAVLAEVGGTLQPLLAFYHQHACLPIMQTRIAHHQRSLIRLIPHIHAKILHENALKPWDTALQSFIDFDTATDMQRHIHSA
ncbi:MAG: molybdenum cofactor guanylyltransferase [Mariprofundaceae bacterium]|nr:molybdenum cofactor guanylyltransferase [Mariprofundaceae bacterium]